MDFSLAFAPLISPVWLAVAALAAVAVTAVLLRQRRAGALLRLLAFALLIAALLDPYIVEADRERLPGVVAVVVDKSLSQRLADRQARSQAVREALAERLGAFSEFEIRWVEAGDTPGNDGTNLFQELARAIADVPPERMAGAVMITDGQVHDVPKSPAALGFDAPLQVLLTGQPDERDRRVVVQRAPRFGLVGQNQSITLRVSDTGSGATGRIALTVRRDGETIATKQVTLGESVDIEVPVAHTGPNIFEFEAEPLDGELTEANNTAVVTTEGIRENLRVLLVSGEPHAGERTWRNLLKSDAAVDLVHFTILRPPEKQDGTPINELSLIAFPTRELFAEKIDEFDLIIFDRYKRRGVLPIIYFDNIARYVRDGGAVLIAAGPDFASPLSIYRSPLSPVLPAEPTGEVVTEPFYPTITEAGAKHPVTRELPGSATSPPSWGRWFRSVPVRPNRGEVLMKGPGETPLLLLSREDKGRVALLLSDQAWLWSRGFEGGGPQIALLRRLSHWLMREPDLEEEYLSATARGGTLTITRRTMGDSPPPVRLTAPDGSEREVTLDADGPGVWRATVETADTGLYRVSNGTLTALANVGPVNPRELADVVTSERVLDGIATATGGRVVWPLAEDGTVNLPRIVPLRAASVYAGDTWIGFKRTDATLLRGLRSLPVLAGLLGLLLLIGSLAATWYREGR